MAISVKTGLAFGYVRPDLAVPGTKFQVELLDRKSLDAEVLAEPIFDPESERAPGVTLNAARIAIRCGPIPFHGRIPALCGNLDKKMSKLPSRRQKSSSSEVALLAASVAYHLTKMGKKDVLLCWNANKLTSGTTWHAAGLVRGGALHQEPDELARYTVSICIPSWNRKPANRRGLKQVGSISIAANPERWEEIRRSASTARAFGVPRWKKSARKKAQAMWPLMQIDDVVGAIHFPLDGQVNPADTTMALAKGARMGGATILEDDEGHRCDPEKGRPRRPAFKPRRAI